MQMAFYNKIGTLLRHNISATNTLHGQTPMINAIRCMSTKLFIGGMYLKDLFSSNLSVFFDKFCFMLCWKLNRVLLIGLSYGTDDQSLRDAFSGFGDVVEGELCLISCKLM